MGIGISIGCSRLDIDAVISAAIALAFGTSPARCALINARSSCSMDGITVLFIICTNRTLTRLL